MALTGTIYSKIAGVSHNNADGESRQELIRKYAKAGLSLTLIPEPTNPHSNTAVGIWLDTSAGKKQIGYIRDTNLDDQLSEYLQKGGRLTCRIAEVTGQAEQTLGVNIQIEIQQPAPTTPVRSPATSKLQRKNPPFILIVIVGILALCVVCIGGSLAMDAMGLIPTSTPSAIPTNTQLPPTVILTLTTRLEGRTLFVNGETDLPDGTILAYEIQHEEYTTNFDIPPENLFQDGFINVAGGRYELQTDLTMFPPGNVDVWVSFQTILGTDIFQPEEIIKRFGINGELLQGDNVSTSSSMKRVVVETTVVLTDQ